MEERGASGQKAILLERNKLVGRKLARFLTCAGCDVVCVEDPAEVRKHLDGALLIAGDAFDAEAVGECLRLRPSLRAVLWTAEPLQRMLKYAIDHPAISNILGRPDFDSTPRPRELMMVLRRLMRPREEGPKFAWYLDWGFAGYQERILDSDARDRAVTKVQRFIEHIGVRKALADSFAELAHEMLMNAMYDAPVDEQGRYKYAQDRKARLVLPEHEQPTLRVASDGTRLAIQVTDSFGRLERKHVFEGMLRGLCGGTMDRSHGGAGLGMAMYHNATAAVFFDVVRGKKTEVTGIVDVELSQREFKAQPKSLHYFSSP